MARQKEEKIGYFDYHLPDKGKCAWVINVRQHKVGSQWKITSVTSETASKQNIRNYASDDTLKFFRRIGGTERRTMGYTHAGYLPREVVSTNPDKTERHIIEFYYGDEGDSFKYHLAKWKMQKAKEQAMKPRRRKA